jgi:hypothetical protein
MIAHGVRKLRELSELQKPEKQETGVAAFDDFTGGLLRGGVCEISGSESSGKRGLVLSVLGGLTRRNFICAVVDTSDAFDPDSAQKAGTNLNKILWIRCGGDIQKALLITDHLLQSKLFGFVWLDLSLCEEKALNIISNSFWFRFKVCLQNSKSSFLVLLSEPRLRSAAHQAVSLRQKRLKWNGASNFRLVENYHSEMRMSRPVFDTRDVVFKAAW